MAAQTLLVDADDTLWENNIYFERAIANFISFLNHHEYTPEQVREVLNQVERESIVSHGYGLHSFAHFSGRDLRAPGRRTSDPFPSRDH
jgi:putative hydrolase of the HAD superfamily